MWYFSAICTLPSKESCLDVFPVTGHRQDIVARPGHLSPKVSVSVLPNVPDYPLLPGSFSIWVFSIHIATL